MTEPLVVVGLLSGGKDSCYNLCHCVKQGHKVAALATLAPPEGKDELDSYMYQTVGHDAVHLIAKAMDLPLYRGVIRGQAINQTSSYGDRTPSSSRQTLLDDADETEDLYKLLCEVKAAQPGINAVSVGAILSNYQRVRVEHVALRAGLHLLPLCYLWQRDQGELLDEMCQIGMMESILIKVAGAGLKEEDLGKSLVRMRTKLHKLHNIYGAHICGEGGEYETFTLDCPLFKKRIVIDQTTTVTHSDSSFASVYYLRIDRAHLEEKTDAGDTLTARVENVKVADLLDPLGRRTLQACTAAAGAVSISEAENTLQARTSHRANRRRKRASVAKQGHWYAFGDITGARSSNIAEEFGSAFDLLIDELREHNLSAAHLAHLSVYLSSQAHFGVLNKVYQMYFGVDPPSRACVAVNMQGGQDKTNLIIDAVAFDDGSLYNVEGAGDDLAAAAAAASSSSSSKSSQPSLRSRKVLHVQSRSYWAAANIGPYSQSVNAGGRITIAGQIGLAPTTLRLVDSPMLQIALALQHARRVFKAILEGRTEKQRGWVEGCICWIDDAQWLKPAAAAWKVQEVVADEDDDDDKDDDNDDVQPGWESEWLGKTFKASDLPLCFIVLPMGGLPRSATIEWQLFAHDGKAVVSELQDDKEDDENQDGEAAVPAILSGEDVTFAGFSGSYQAISSKQGASTFGIASLRRSLGTTAPSSSHLLLLLSNALSVKILHHQEKGIDLIEEEIRKIPAAATFLPVCACYDDQMRVCDVTIIWQGVSR